MMHPFEIFFLNNGAAVFQTNDFCHVYDDMAQMAQDFAVYQKDGHTIDWDGDDIYSRVEYSVDQERNGGYLCITEGCWADLDDEWGYNTDRFLLGLEQAGYHA
jgi:hypothetical protein